MYTMNEFVNQIRSLIVHNNSIIGLTHWGRVMHPCVGKLTIIGSDNGLSPGRPQAIIWTNAGILLIGPLGTNFSEILKRNSNIFIQENVLENVVCEMASILSRPWCVKYIILRTIKKMTSLTHAIFFMGCGHCPTKGKGRFLLNMFFPVRCKCCAVETLYNNIIFLQILTKDIQ